MSVQADIQNFLVTLAEGTTGREVHIEPNQVAIQTGYARDHVSKTLANLAARKRIELLRGPNGRSIIGYRLLEPPVDKRRRNPSAHQRSALDNGTARVVREVTAEELMAKSPQVRVRRVHTPKLDEYEQKKLTFQQLTEALGDSFEGSFKQDDIAEEALYLKERTEQLIEQNRELRQELSDVTRERDALRTRHIRSTEEKAMAAGAMVQHSVD